MNWMDVHDLTSDASGSGAGGEQRGGETNALGPVAGLLDGLNEPQRAACTHFEGPLSILAGPGSGKTRVITHRVVHLLTERGVRPAEVLAITFTNKAAREMRERVERLLPGIKGLWISTFHAMGARILRREIGVLEGYTRDFSIFDTSDRNQLLKRIIKDLGYDATRFRPAMVGGWISGLKNQSTAATPEHGGDSVEGIEDEVLRRIRKRYDETMRANNALDFDDLLLKTFEIFDQHPGVREAYARRFRFVMVDEYQDTNRVQYLLTRQLSSVHGNLAVCGDPDQSIYAWRGADIRNILDFEADFGAATLVKLEQNYRSKGHILKAAHAVISNNQGRKDKQLWTEGEDGELLTVVECGDENDEGREIALQIKSLVNKGKQYADCAIFYRANFMQRSLESALRLAGIPYQVVGGVEFYARKEVRDLVSFLRLIVNPNDEIAFRRVVNVPARGVGDTSLGRLATWAGERGLSMLQAARSDEALALIRGRAKKGLAEFREIIGRLEDSRDGDAGVALDLVLEEIDRDKWMADMDDGSGVLEREANVDELRSHAQEYDRLNPLGGLRGFLEEVALVSDVDSLSEEVPGVTLMTLHSAKGLEFGNVFVAGVEEELLPHARALAEGADPEAGIEEERRLLYVGMTRAEERLFLTHAKTRLHFGESRWSRPSRFLDEIPPELIEGHDSAADDFAFGEYEPPASSPQFKVGELVVHDHFGTGRIEALQGSGVNARATVVFVQHGTKQLLLQYANLRRAGAAS